LISAFYVVLIRHALAVACVRCESSYVLYQRKVFSRDVLHY
jgi:hypothetical protein